jgi:hypothetical protein
MRRTRRLSPALTGCSAVSIYVEIPARPRHRGLAMDRRSKDSEGRLTVTRCLVTSASVCAYKGSEIPGWESMGLDPDKIYDLWRDSEALAAACSNLNGQPLMADHIGVSAQSPQQSMIVGTLSDAEWDGKNIYATISVWDANAIRDIESGARRDLSCGYKYTPDMTPGKTPAGERYDGVMRGPFEWNHIALVPLGRVVGAQVSDHALPGRPAVLTVDVQVARAPVSRLIPNIDRL